MADWHLVSLRWTEGPPAPHRVTALNAMLKELDYDAPALTETGITCKRWRSPLLDITEFLDFFHVLGHPCEGKLTLTYWDDDSWVSEASHERREWERSNPTYHETFAHITKLVPTRFERITDSSE